MAKIDIFAKQDNTMVNSLEGVKLYVYGGGDTGKTSQMMRLEKPMLIMAEAGGTAINEQKFPVDDWDDFTQIVTQLTSPNTYKKAREMYQSIIIDTAEALVSIVEQKIAKRYGVIDISMVQEAADSNPNGFMLSRSLFKNQINLLTRHGYTVVFISHEMVDDNKKSPTHGKIIPYGSNKEKGSTRFIRDLCDFVIYTYANGVDEETGKTIYSSAICKETKDVFARSRFSAMTTYIKEFTAENVSNEIIKAIEAEAKNSGAGLTSFTEKNTAYTKEDYFAMLQPYVEKLFKTNPEFVTSQVEEVLGEGKKVTDATDMQITELGSLYSTLVDYCTQRGIDI